MGQLTIQKHFSLVLAVVAGGLVLLAVLWVRSWSAECDAALKRALQQYGELQSYLSEYAVQRRDATRASQPESENLFRLLNEKGTKLGIARRIEGMRPASGRDAAVELLDVRVRSLYLSECMKLIDAIEQTERVGLDSINIQVTDKGLLNVDMRVFRKKE